MTMSKIFLILVVYVVFNMAFIYQVFSDRLNLLSWVLLLVFTCGVLLMGWCSDVIECHQQKLIISKKEKLRCPIKLFKFQVRKRKRQERKQSLELILIQFYDSWKQNKFSIKHWLYSTYISNKFSVYDVFRVSQDSDDDNDGNSSSSSAKEEDQSSHQNNANSTDGGTGSSSLTSPNSNANSNAKSNASTSSKKLKKSVHGGASKSNRDRSGCASAPSTTSAPSPSETPGRSSSKPKVDGKRSWTSTPNRINLPTGEAPGTSGAQTPSPQEKRVKRKSSTPKQRLSSSSSGYHSSLLTPSSGGSSIYGDCGFFEQSPAGNSNSTPSRQNSDIFREQSPVGINNSTPSSQNSDILERNACSMSPICSLSNAEQSPAGNSNSTPSRQNSDILRAYAALKATLDQYLPVSSRAVSSMQEARPEWPQQNREHIRRRYLERAFVDNVPIGEHCAVGGERLSPTTPREGCVNCLSPVCVTHAHLHRGCVACRHCRHPPIGQATFAEECNTCSSSVCAGCSHQRHTCLQYCDVLDQAFVYPLGDLPRCSECEYLLCLCQRCHRCQPSQVNPCFFG